jgi:hypothetical protein
MVLDTNPSFGRDRSYSESARKVTQVLWDATQGDLSKIPESYLSGMGFEYSDGQASFLDLLNKVSLSKGTYEEYMEVVNKLIHTNYNEWPKKEQIIEIQAEKLLGDSYEDFSELEDLDFDFAQPGDMSDKMETFLKKVIASVYTDGVTAVTDSQGDPPNQGNNYLFNAKDKIFSGIFHDSPKGGEKKQFDFQISEKSDGTWQISY